MANGDVWVAYAWQGAYATLLGKGVPVAYADPKEGRNSWVGVYGIRKGTPNLELALKFLDDKLANATVDERRQPVLLRLANQEVMRAITDATLKQAFSVDDPTVLQRTNFTPNLTAKQRDDWTAMWTEVKAAPLKLPAGARPTGAARDILGPLHPAGRMGGPVFPGAARADVRAQLPRGHAGRPAQPLVADPRPVRSALRRSAATGGCSRFRLPWRFGVALAAVALAYPVAYFLVFRAGRAAGLCLSPAHSVLDQLSAPGHELEVPAGVGGRDQFLTHLRRTSSRSRLSGMLYSRNTVVVTLIYVWIPFAALPICGGPAAHRAASCSSRPPTSARRRGAASGRSPSR